MGNEPFIRQLSPRNCLSFGSEAAPVTLGRLNVLIGPNASGKSNLVEAVGVLRAATRDLTAPFKETGIEEWLWKGPAGEKRESAAEIEAIFTQPQTDVELRYRLALTKGAGGRTELVDELLENNPPGREPHPYVPLPGGASGRVLVS